MRYNDKDTILCALEQNAYKNPEHTALMFKDTRYTWRELHELTDRAAAQLLQDGVRRGECVGIQITGGLEVLAILSILKTGASYMPLNPVFPEERLTYMRDNSGVKRTVFEDDIEKLMRSESGALPTDLTGQDKLAVIYTSGSTGLPKAVTLFHRDAVPYARCCMKTAGLTEKDIFAMYFAVSFVGHMMSLFAWVLSGAALYVLPDEIRLDVRKIAEYFNRYAITAVMFPTGIGRKVLSKAVIPSLKAVTLGGERLTPFQSVNTGLRVFNTYGCTESAGAFSIGQIRPDSRDLHVGKEADGVSVSIVGENGNPVPDGAEGELWVTLFGRLHKTGDLAKRNKDGNIEILGRRDFQLNVRGYRVEPGEIEACLLTFPQIAEAVAVMRGKRLVAYYAAEDAADPQTLRNHLSAHLPPYMIPSLFMRLDKLPRNVNGKLDRAALPEPVYPKAGGKMPESETEKHLADIWRNVLSLDKEIITRASSFRELGGDSLSLIILTAEIDEKLHAVVSPADLQKMDTLEKQAALIKNTKGFSPVFTFRAKGDKAPLFFAHTANSGPEVYAKLAGQLPENQPFYAFEHLNLVRSKELSIRELAEIYANEMLKMYPHEPCVLGGWSFGGLISFEMAVILEQKGFALNHLYLIDPQICGDIERDIYAALDSTPYYREYLESEPLFTRFRDDGRIERLIRNNTICAREASHYKPCGTLSCPVTLFRMTLPDSAEHANENEQALLAQLWELKKPDNGFGPFTKALKIINVAETHDRALVNNASIQVIAREITQDAPTFTKNIRGV